MAGRRKIGIENGSAWVFNRMAHVYDARPAYPAEPIQHISDAAGSAPSSVVDLGAGMGHIALPLAERGLQVVAVEPAIAMLDCLREQASQRGLTVRCLHAAAEALPLEPASIDLAVVADAMHFLDAALTGRELKRVLKPTGALAVVTCDLGDTPFMRALVSIMEDAAPRRPRATQNPIVQLAGVAGLSLGDELLLVDHTPIDHTQLERILRSISFIGPAMNEERFASFWARVRALSDQPIWSRSFRLRRGTRT